MVSTLEHFAHAHALKKTKYNSTDTHKCDICQSKMAGFTGYSCSDSCNFHIHEPCADYFKEEIVFFAHPWHKLSLTRIPKTDPPSKTTWSCDLCREPCPPGNLVYRCIDCHFDVHPLCTMLPQTIRSDLHPKRPQHDLHMVPGSGSHNCHACKEALPVWRYVCSCSFRIHITCVSGAPCRGGPTKTSGSQSKNSTNAAEGSSASQSQTTSSSNPIVVKFLLNASFRQYINAATGGAAWKVLDVLSAASDC